MAFYTGMRGSFACLAEERSGQTGCEMVSLCITQYMTKRMPINWSDQPGPELYFFITLNSTEQTISTSQC